MKISKEEQDDSYFVAENSFSKMFTFKQILKSNSDKIDNSNKYVIELNNGK